jgi:hypothetical protein
VATTADTLHLCSGNHAIAVAFMWLSLISLQFVYAPFTFIAEVDTAL